MYFCMKFGLTLFYSFKIVYILFDRRTNITRHYIIFYCLRYLKVEVQTFPNFSSKNVELTYQCMLSSRHTKKIYEWHLNKDLMTEFWTSNKNN